MTKPKPKHLLKTRGVPSTYKPEYHNKAVYKLCLLGAIDREISDVFGITEKTLNEWKKKYPKFGESIKKGKNPSDADVAESLYLRAMGYKHEEEKIFQHMGEIVTYNTIKHYPPDPTAMIFWLKNRQRSKWRDTQDFNQTISERRDLTKFSNDQLDKIIENDGKTE